MALNGVMVLILCYFTEFGSFRCRCAMPNVVEDVVVKNFMFAISSPDEFLVSVHIHVRYMLSPVARPSVSVCRLSSVVSVCNVRTQLVEIFSNVSSPLDTLATR